MTSLKLVVVAFAAFAAALLIVLTRRWHARWTGDFEDSGVQKHHKGSPPRVGAVALAVGTVVWVALLRQDGAPAAEAARLLALVALSSLPVMLLGLVEDVTKRVSPGVRLLGAAASAVLALVLIGVRITGMGIPSLDPLVAWLPVSVLATVLMTCGFTNAMNIVDGLNGLASGLGVMMFAATGVVAAGMGDLLVLQLCLGFGVVLSGFFLVNFPRGHLFLGDGGAYFVGFVLVQVWLVFLNRNPSVTPWFVMAVAFHPTMETVFSIYRRRLHAGRKRDALAPDRLHMHSLVYRRHVLLGLRAYPWVETWVGNALASALVLLLAAAPMVAAVFWPQSTVWNLAVFSVGVAAYLWAFSRLIHFGSARAPVEAAHSGEVVRAG